MVDLLNFKPVKQDVSTSCPTQQEAEDAVRTLLRWVGEDPSREGLKDTPHRVVNSYRELFSGYRTNPEKFLKAVFTDVSGYQEAVIIKGIEFVSHCEHHMLPFIGKVHIAYIPENCVVGLSKFARIVDIYARQLQTQEALTAQIGDFLFNFLKTKGVAIIVEAEHLCMSMRGIKKRGATTVTLRYYGDYKKDLNLQNQFFKFINLRS